MFDTLNSVLFSYQLKPMLTTLVERESDSSQPCIVFFSEPETRISLLLSANKILPENAFVVFEPNWIKVSKNEEETALYILEGITMNEWGQCFYVKFKTPQKVTCLCNFLTEENFSFSPLALKQKAHQFRNYEKLTNCPMSSSTELNQYIDDKLHTRLLAVAAKISVPSTIAFSFGLEKYNYHRGSDQVQLVNLSQRKPSLEEIRQYLSNFPFDKFVIKPSGARWMQGRACSIESKENLDRAVTNLQKGLDLISEKECLLVEEFIDPRLKPNYPLGARLRIFVTRRPNNLVQTSGILCNLGYVDQQISGDTSESFSIEYLCNYIGLTDPEKNQLIEQLNKLGETILSSVIDYEDQYLHHIPPHQQTDFIGLDVFLKNNNDQLEPFLIEVNNCDCTSTLQLYEIQHSPHRTSILDKWVETMLYRSYQYMLKGQNILLLGGASKEKLKSCEWAAKLGINLILAENEPPSSPLSFSSQFLGVDFEEGKEWEKSLAIIQEIRHHELNVDGVVSLEEKYLALATLVANFLQKPSNSYESVTLAKSKLLISKKILLDEFEKLSFEARKFSHGVEVFVLNCLNDIQNIPLDYYPLLIESESKNSEFIPKIVSTPKELIAYGEDYQPETDMVLARGVKLDLNDRLIATPYLNGLSQDVLLILSEGELRAGYLIPSLTTKLNRTQENTEILPSLLHQERQENLIYSAWKACHNLNLKEGIFYVKGISTDLGAKILDIHLSLGKMDLVKWMFNLWDIDLILYSSLIACGFKPYVHKNPGGIFDSLIKSNAGKNNSIVA